MPEVEALHMGLEVVVMETVGEVNYNELAVDCNELEVAVVICEQVGVVEMVRVVACKELAMVVEVVNTLYRAAEVVALYKEAAVEENVPGAVENRLVLGEAVATSKDRLVAEENVEAVEASEVAMAVVGTYSSTEPVVVEKTLVMVVGVNVEEGEAGDGHSTVEVETVKVVGVVMVMVEGEMEVVGMVRLEGEMVVVVRAAVVKIGRAHV